MGDLIKILPENVVPLITKEPVILEPRVTVEFNSEFIDSNDTLKMEEFNKEYEKAECLPIKTLLRNGLPHPSND